MLPYILKRNSTVDIQRNEDKLLEKRSVKLERSQRNMNSDGTPLTYSPHITRSPRGYSQNGLSGNYQRQVDLVQQSRASASPHHHARQAMANRSNGNNIMNGSSQSLLTSSSLSSVEDNNKPSEWTAIDLGGMLIKSVSPALFKYDFLTVLYLNHNMLQSLSPDIRFLRSLVTLDVSGNKLKSLPPELGKMNLNSCFNF